MKARIAHKWVFRNFGGTVMVSWAVTYDGTTWEADTWDDALKLAQLLTRKDTP